MLTLIHLAGTYRTTLASIVITVGLVGFFGLNMLPSQASEAAGRIYYVNQAATGSNTGMSWENAFTSLQSALSIATYGDEIWVAAGTYKPTQQKVPPVLTPFPTMTPTPDSRNSTFELGSGVALYGGFNGTETSRDQRNWQANSTILDGDVGEAGVSRDNSYHVVEITSGDATTMLDGFTVTGGNAQSAYEPLHQGGGIYIARSSASIRNIILRDNIAYYGGGIYSYLGSPSVSNVVFTGNSAAYYGGGMYAYVGSPVLTSVRFSGNTANRSGGGLYTSGSTIDVYNTSFSGNTTVQNEGGGLYTWGSMLTLKNVTLSGNTAVAGSGIYQRTGTVQVANSIVWGNTGSVQIAAWDSNVPTISYSLVQGGYAGDNRDADPQFIDANGPDEITGTLMIICVSSPPHLG